MSKVTIYPNYKESKVTKCPKIKDVQSYNMSKFTKCPKLQNVQITKCLITT